VAKYFGTKDNDSVVGAAEADYFYDFGLGHDVLTGGGKNDTFYLVVDEITDTVDGRDGNDTIDYSGSKYAVRIDLLNGSVTATFHHQYPISYDATVTVTQVQNIENAAGSIYGDTIYGTNGSNTLDGNTGDDWLYGRDGNDTLLGGAGVDHLYGGNQDDTLIGGTGNDYISGGAGLGDTVSYADADRGTGVALNLSNRDGLNGLAANQALLDNHVSIFETDTVVGVENAIGTGYSDYVVGGSEENVLDGGAGNDWLLGHGGNDTLIGGDGDDHLFGHEGADRLVGGNGSDWACYYDEIWDWDMSVNPGTVVISLANPSLNTWWAAGDTYDGIENIEGSSFNDVITGDDHDNIIVDTTGSNKLYGNGGKDTLVGNPDAADTFDGGNEEDTVDYSWTGATDTVGTATYVTVDLEHQSVNAGAAAGDRFYFVEDITGTRHDDTIYGDYANNTFRGLDGSDRLMGRGGDDTLIGGEGTDTAVFSGNFADYTFRTLHFNDGERFLEVHDTHADRDGTDYVIEVERLEFHNTTVNTSDLMLHI
jgi:Ca2+-binding RTX toxin-like protein